MDAITALAARGYQVARSVSAPEAGDGLGQAIMRSAHDFAATLRRGDNTAQAAATGGADSYALVMAMAQTELAVEAAVSVRDRVVEAYQEILRMPV